MHLISFRLPNIGDSIPEATPSWQDSEEICALADSERHLGHVVKTDLWHAYDATRANLAWTDFRYLGAFADLETAKTVVESATHWINRRTMKVAAASPRPS
jgi:hypothetical protein